MNIREHIEARHYPTDDKGRALVPMKNGNTATICATDGPQEGGRYHVDIPLVGFHWCGALAWNADGVSALPFDQHLNLLPPPPRKVKVTVWVLFNSKGEPCNVFEKPHVPVHGMRMVEMTGEYEELWL
jgi:hypothetical protein